MTVTKTEPIQSLNKSIACCTNACLSGAIIPLDVCAKMILYKNAWVKVCFIQSNLWTKATKKRDRTSNLGLLQETFRLYLEVTLFYFNIKAGPSLFQWGICVVLKNFGVGGVFIN